MDILNALAVFICINLPAIGVIWWLWRNTEKWKRKAKMAQEWIDRMNEKAPSERVVFARARRNSDIENWPDEIEG